MNRKLVLPVLFLSGFLSACETGSVAPPTDQASIDNGRMVAERECSACHATGLSGPSPRREAPRFRNILSRYHADMLEAELVQGIRVAHSEMPQFQLNPK